MTAMLWLELSGAVALAAMAFWCDRFCSREFKRVQERYDEAIAQQEEVARMLDELKAGVE